MVYANKQSVPFCQSMFCYFWKALSKSDDTRAQIVFIISLHYHMAMNYFVLAFCVNNLPYICDVAMTVIT